MADLEEGEISRSDSEGGGEPSKSTARSASTALPTTCLPMLVSQLATLKEMGYVYRYPNITLLAQQHAMAEGATLSIEQINIILDLQQENKIAELKAKNAFEQIESCCSSSSKENCFATLQAMLGVNQLSDKPERIYVLDEKRLTVGSITTEAGDSQPVIVSMNKLPVSICQNKPEEQNSACATILSCTNASGFQILLWGATRDIPKHDIHSNTWRPSGIVNFQVYSTYLKDYLVKFLPSRCEDSPVVVMYDAHMSPLCVPLIHWAQKNHILMFVIPSVLSHIVQPHPLKWLGLVDIPFQEECQEFSRQHPGHEISCSDIIQIATKAYSRIHVGDFKIGFRKAGLHPLDPSIVRSVVVQHKKATHPPTAEKCSTDSILNAPSSATCRTGMARPKSSMRSILKAPTSSTTEKTSSTTEKTSSTVSVPNAPSPGTITWKNSSNDSALKDVSTGLFADVVTTVLAGEVLSNDSVRNPGTAQIMVSKDISVIPKKKRRVASSDNSLQSSNKVKVSKVSLPGSSEVSVMSVKPRNHKCINESGPDAKPLPKLSCDLAKHVRSLASMGYHCTISGMALLAEHHSIALSSPLSQPAKKWVRKFKRGQNLSKLVERSQETQKESCLSCANKEKYFKALQATLLASKLHNRLERIYILDEKCLTIEQNDEDEVKIVACKTGKEDLLTKATPTTAIEEIPPPNTTVLSCSNVYGIQVPPYFVIRETKRSEGDKDFFVPLHSYSPELLSQLSPDSSGSITATGVPSYQVYHDYLREHFVKFCPERSGDLPLVLLYDAHMTPLCYPLLEWAETNHIITFTIPPLLSHAVHPHTLKWLGTVEMPLSQECQDFQEKHPGQPISAPEICRVASSALSNMSTSDFEVAFQRAGICPLNPAAVNSEIFLLTSLSTLAPDERLALADIQAATSMQQSEKRTAVKITATALASLTRAKKKNLDFDDICQRKALEKSYVDADVEKAFRAVTQEHMCLRKAARVHNVPAPVLYSSITGSLGEPCKSLVRSLSREGEIHLISHVEAMADCGYSYTKQAVEEIADAFAINSGVLKGCEELRVGCITRLLRHWPDLQLMIDVGQTLDTPLIESPYLQKTKSYAGALRDIITRHGLTSNANRIYYIDETKLSSGQKPQVVSIDGSHSSCMAVSILSATSAAGDQIPPYFVFPRHLTSTVILKQLPDEADGCVTEYGDCDHDTFEKYIKGHLLRLYYEKSSDDLPLLLLYSGYKSQESMLEGKDDDQTEESSVTTVTAPSLVVPQPYQTTRLLTRANYSSASGSSSSDSSDDDSHYRPRRSKAKKKRVLSMDMTACEQSGTNGSSMAGSGGMAWSGAPVGQGSHKRNNVWGEVLQEQTLSQTMVSLGVDMPDYLDSDRNVESYDFKRAKDDDRPDLAAMVDISADPNDPFAIVVDPGGAASARRGTKRGRKPIKERLLPQTFDVSKSRDHIKATVDDSEPEVVSSIVNLLDEPKVDLIARIVQIIGRRKSLELAYLTEDVEAAGGMMICNGYRRRTAGGVYIRLLKFDPDISKEQIDEIFAEEEKVFKKESKKRYRAKRKRRLKELAAEHKMAMDDGDNSADETKAERIDSDDELRDDEPAKEAMTSDTIKSETISGEFKSGTETLDCIKSAELLSSSEVKLDQDIELNME